MVVHGDTAIGVIEHLLIDLIDTTGDGFHQSSTSDNSIELQGKIDTLKFVEHELLAIVELFDDVVEMCQVFIRV